MKKYIVNFYQRVPFLFVIAAGIPVMLFAQTDINSTLAQNSSLVQSFALLGPMALSPFWTLFITSFASTFKMGNDYIASNPMLDNGIVLVISFLLVLITTLPNLTKVSKPIGLAANFLENKAGYVIYVLMMVAPYLLMKGDSTQQGMVTFGFFSFPIPVILMIVLALPYFLVVMTVRYFIEILIFLSPIPLLDAFFEFIKKGFTFFLIVIYFVFPTFGFISSILLFIISFMFFKRAKRVSNFFQYIYVYPIFEKLFGGKQDLISEKLPINISRKYPNISLAIKCLTGKKTSGIPSKSIVWMIKSDKGLVLYQPKIWRSPIIVQLDKMEYKNLQLSSELYYQILHDSKSQLKILLNNNYKGLSDEICSALNIEIKENVGLAKTTEELSEQGKKGIQKLMKIFSFRQISASKETILGE